MKRDGGLIHISLNVSPITDDEGTVVGASAIGIDITARKKVEEELRASEEQFRQLAEALPQLVWMTGPDGSATYLNAKWNEYTGASFRGYYLVSVSLSFPKALVAPFPSSLHA